MESEFIEAAQSKSLYEFQTETDLRNRLIVVGTAVAEYVGRDLSTLTEDKQGLLDEAIILQSQGKLKFPDAYGPDFTEKVRLHYT